jgi:hypothetical protein
MRCFVIMPFGNPKTDPDRSRKLDLIYSQWIKPTIESICPPGSSKGAISCHRADKEAGPGEIISHIMENLTGADIVVADLSGKNPNVFYELGVRHALKNNTILISDDLDDIPFDLRGLRTIVYKYEPEHMLNLKESLQQAVTTILANPEKMDSPVLRFLYEREVNRLTKQETPLGFDLFKNILAEMSALKREIGAQSDQFRTLLKDVTDRRLEKPSLLVTPSDLAFYEGAWSSPDTGSHYYIRVIKGVLLAPYCYGGDNDLTAHFRDFRLLGDTLFGRFEWFHTKLSGFLFLRRESERRLTGGWWYDTDLPEDIASDFLKVNDTIPGMIPLVLEREKRKTPEWAEKYFNKVVAEGHVPEPKRKRPISPRRHPV